MDKRRHATAGVSCPPHVRGPGRLRIRRQLVPVLELQAVHPEILGAFTEVQQVALSLLWIRWPVPLIGGDVFRSGRRLGRQAGQVFDDPRGAMANTAAYRVAVYDAVVGGVGDRYIATSCRRRRRRPPPSGRLLRLGRRPPSFSTDPVQATTWRGIAPCRPITLVRRSRRACSRTCSRICGFPVPTRAARSSVQFRLQRAISGNG